MMKSLSKSPVLSVVVTTRNDDDEALRRMQIFTDNLFAQVESFRLPCELIVVEWNPPSDRPSLANAIKWQTRSNWSVTRIINVPLEIHNRFENSDVIPLFQMIAKNVGIRRACGQFVLATNVDILFSNELMHFLASGKLRADRMYRVDRYDIPAEIPAHLTLVEQLNWCKENVLKVYRYKETVEAHNGMVPPGSPGPAYWTQFKDWLFSRQVPLHTNACGDFTMLSAESWNKVHGHPELPLRAMKLDGLLCYSAHYSGAREFVLKDPLRIYHLDHPARSDGAIIALSKRGADGRNLQLPVAQYRAWIEQMQKSRRPVVFNDLNWGLADVVLSETVIG